MKADLVKLEVGKPFPGMVPSREGAWMELRANGTLDVVLQLPGVTRQERRAFQKGVRRVTYVEWPGNVPIALWVFDFRPPLNPLDVNFNACIVQPESVKAYLHPPDGGITNACTFLLLDGQTLRGQKLFGLPVEAVQLFHDTIRKQLAAGYQRHEYELAIRQVFQQHSTYELQRMGKTWRIGK